MNKVLYKIKRRGKGLILIVFIGTIGLASCAWDELPPPEFEVPDVVSFSIDIIPIFEMRCATTNCHDGSFRPDLRADVAYDELINGGFINTNSPENSSLYTKIDGGSMEQYATDQDRAIILKWIAAGAEDN